MSHYKVKQKNITQWIICEGEEVESCAGDWPSENEARGVADLLNESYQEVLASTDSQYKK